MHIVFDVRSQRIKLRIIKKLLFKALKFPKADDMRKLEEKFDFSFPLTAHKIRSFEKHINGSENFDEIVSIELILRISVMSFPS